jgi:hypothetical protein
MEIARYSKSRHYIKVLQFVTLVGGRKNPTNINRHLMEMPTHGKD